MTREEIVEGLKLLEDNMVHFDELQNDKGEWIDVHELLFEAIQALSQEPTEKPMTVDEMEREYEKSKALFHKIVECDDAISREYLFKVLDDFCGHDRTATITLDTLADLVYELPSVTQKSGKWRRVSIEKYIQHAMAYYECSECGGQTIGEPKYCPNCGAKMESEG